MPRIGRAVLGLLLATVACVVAPAQAASAADVVACQVTYDPQAHTGGFTSEITVRNTGTATIYGWTLAFPLEESVRIVSMWNAVLITPTGEITARNASHNGNVAPNTSINVGFLATGTATATPSWFTVNGVRCAIAN